MKKLRFIGETKPWGEKKLGEVADFHMGFTPSTKKPEYWNGNNQWLNVKGLGNNKYLTHGNKMISNEAIRGKKVFVPGTLLMSFKLSLGELGITTIPIFTNEAICGFNPHDGLLTEYLYYVLDNTDLKNYAQRAVMGYTMNTKSIEKVNIPLPSLPEQEKIGGFLSALDAEIESQSELVDLLALEYKGYSQQIFSQKLRFKDENGNEYPEWEEKKLGEVADITGGYSFQSKDYATSGSRVIRISDVQSGFISDKDAKFIQEPKENSAILAYQLSSGDIVMSLTGIVGRVAKIEESHTPCYLNQRVAKIIPHEKSNDKFIYSLLNNPSFEKQAMDNATGGAQKNMKTSWLSKFNIPFPSLSEQEKIGGFLSSLSNRLESEKELLIQLKEQKKAYLQKLLP